MSLEHRHLTKKNEISKISKIINTLNSIVKAFEEEKMGTQKFVISHKIVLSCHDWKITIKYDDKSHKDCNIRVKLEHKKQIKQSLILIP